MERQIKFRAFDDGKMLSMPLNTNYGISRFFGIIRVDAVIMQFTGLKDINGVDTYEGDILDNLEVVRFSEGAFMTSIGALCLSANHRKVIGNIYENENLL